MAVDAVALVGVRPGVVAEAEHAFGNLFHRLHYFAQKMEGKGVEGAAAMETAVTDLEDLLRLVLDYVSPLPVTANGVPAATVLGGLGLALGHAVETPPAALEGAQVYADSSHLSQAFHLMRRAFGSDGAAATAPRPWLEEDHGARWLRVDGFEPGRNAIASGRGLVAWALAQKLIEAQGGLLSGSGEADGVRWSLRLPLPVE